MSEHKHEVYSVTMRDIAGQTIVMQQCSCGATRTIIYAGPAATPEAWKEAHS